MQQGDLTVDAIRTIHPPLVDCYALSFKTPDQHIVFSGDTAPLPLLADFAQGADLLIHEAMLETALPDLMKRIGNASDKLMAHWLRSHTFAHDVAKLATSAGVKSLALNHLIPSDDPTYTSQDWENAVAPFWDGELHVGCDGMRIAIKD